MEKEDTQDEINKLIQADIKQQAYRKEYYQKHSDYFKEKKKQYRAEKPEVEKAWVERVKHTDAYKERIKKKNAAVYQRRKARLAAQKLEEQAKGLQTAD